PAAGHSRHPHGDSRGDKRAGRTQPKTARVPPDGRREHSRSATLVARTHDDDARAAHRKDDAVLARPLRHQRRESEGWLLDVAAERHAPPARAWKLRHAHERDLARPGDDDLPRFATEPERTPERELGARIDGAVHRRDRELFRN